tara:strand:- start:269 stop:619 length:351 start_codon:yes stop_codon:yes gene_type:complete
MRYRVLAELPLGMEQELDDMVEGDEMPFAGGYIAGWLSHYYGRRVDFELCQDEFDDLLQYYVMATFNDRDEAGAWAARFGGAILPNEPPWLISAAGEDSYSKIYHSLKRRTAPAAD